jgi:hypothetical protein
MDDKKKEYEESLLKRLDIIINLLLEKSEENGGTATSKALKLDSFGLKPNEIGRIIGKPSRTVSATLLMAKKKKGKRGKNG